MTNDRDTLDERLQRAWRDGSEPALPAGFRAGVMQAVRSAPVCSFAEESRVNVPE